MRAAFLHLDGALLAQPALVAAGGGDGRELDARDLGRRLRLWSSPADLAAAQARLCADLPAAGPEVVFTGSGDFHHVCALLIERAVEGLGEPITVIHFDNHPDWVRYEDGLHCGSWVGRVASLAGVDRVITVGPCSRDIGPKRAVRGDLRPIARGKLELYALRHPDGEATLDLCGHRWPTMENLGEAAFAELLLSRVRTPAVYMTVDKDVLRGEDAVTNWDQGDMRLRQMLQLIGALLGRHRFAGADVVGDWSPQGFGGGLGTRVLKWGEVLLDQPHRRPDALAAARVNQAANLSLLSAFQEAAA